MTEAAKAKLIERWWKGDSISEAQASILRNTGEKLDFEAVRAAFADLSHSMGAG